MECTSAKAGERSARLKMWHHGSSYDSDLAKSFTLSHFTARCRGALATVRAGLPSWLGGIRRS